MKTFSNPRFHPRQPNPGAPAGFTRTELVATLTALTFCLTVVLPALAATAPRAGQITCFNNLRLLGQATQIFASEHYDLFSWRTPEELGGTARIPRPGNVWWEFGVLSNELVTPKILACPSDAETTRAAKDFSRDPDGGLFHFTYRNNAISYLLGLDAFPTAPNIIVAGDRNIQVQATGVSCSSGINNAAAIFGNTVGNSARWTNSIHGNKGNMLFGDGSVVQLSNDALATSDLAMDDNGSIHVLMPK